MSKIKWTIFEKEIEDDFDHIELPTSVEQSRIAESNDEGYYSLDDILTDVFYVTSLEQITSAETIKEKTDPSDTEKEHLERLKKYNQYLCFFLRRGKEIIAQFDVDFNALNMNQSNQGLESVTNDYTDILYRIVRKAKIYSLEDILPIEQTMISLVDNNGEELQAHFNRLHKELSEYAENSSKLQRDRIYKSIRVLPLYLGDEYKRRYVLYQKFIKYPKIKTNLSYRRKPVVQRIMNNVDFNEYYVETFNSIVRNIEQVQKESFKIDNIIDKGLFNIAAESMLEAINESSKAMKKAYMSGYDANPKNGKRCFALMYIYGKGKQRELYTFSGLFDSTCLHVTRAFETNTKFINAIQKISKSVRFASSIWVRTSGDEKYYYDDHKSVTLKATLDAMLSGYDNMKRMYSCCERKLIAYSEIFTQIDKYEIYCKYEPCELCIPAIAEYGGKVTGKITAGEAHDTKVRNKANFDALARAVAGGKTGIAF